MILGACIVVVADNWGVLASVVWVAGVDSAAVVVVAVHWPVDATAVLVTSLDGALVSVVTFFVSNVSEHASFLWVAFLFSALVVVVAHNRLVFDLSGLRAAVVSGALVVVIDILGSEAALSGLRVTGVDGARVVVVAHNWRLDDSLTWLAVNLDAQVVRVDWDW